MFYYKTSKRIKVESKAIDLVEKRGFQFDYGDGNRVFQIEEATLSVARHPLEPDWMFSLGRVRTSNPGICCETTVMW